MAAMPWPRRSTPENLHGFADLLRPADLAGVDEEVQAAALGARIDMLEFTGGHAQFVAANPEGHNARRGATARGFHNIQRQLRPKLPHGIENPVEA